MKLIATTHRIMRATSMHDFSAVQRLERRAQLLGITVWVTVLDREEVPSRALIQLAALGSTEWESRLFKQYAHLLGDQR